jgi:hypothetical protein
MSGEQPVAADRGQLGGGVSLFERLMAPYDRQIAHRLTLQYRVHKAIMGFSSMDFYQGDAVTAAESGHHRGVRLCGASAVCIRKGRTSLGAIVWLGDRESENGRLITVHCRHR